MLRSGRLEESDSPEEVLCCGLGGEFLALSEERMAEVAAQMLLGVGLSGIAYRQR